MYYICETNPEVRVYFESENKVVNLTGVDLSRRIDGVSPEGDISLSKYATDFHDKYRRNILKSALAGDCEFEDKIVFMLRMMGTGLSMNLSNNFLVRNTLFCVDFVIKYNFDDSIKDLYLKVYSYSCEHYVKLNCCDEFLSILESCYDSKDLDKACDSVISYFGRNDVFIKALQSDGVVEIHGLCDKNFVSLVKECCVKEVFCEDN